MIDVTAQVVAATNARPYTLHSTREKRSWWGGVEETFLIKYQGQVIRSLSGVDREFAQDIVGLMNSAYQVGGVDALSGLSHHTGA